MKNIHVHQSALKKLELAIFVMDHIREVREIVKMKIPPNLNILYVLKLHDIQHELFGPILVAQNS